MISLAAELAKSEKPFYIPGVEYDEDPAVTLASEDQRKEWTAIMEDGKKLAELSWLKLACNTARKLFRRQNDFNFNPLIPHMSVKDVTKIDWKKLKEKTQTIKYIIFDKENTLTRAEDFEYYRKEYYEKSQIERSVYEC